MLKDLLRTADLHPEDVPLLLALATELKQDPYRRRTALQNDTVVLYFNKPSTRTRVSFETAVARLGGLPVTMGPNELQLDRGETVEDTARVISRYARAFILRTHQDSDAERFASAASIPVINALTDGHHPCQSLADLLTLRDKRGKLHRLRLAYLGAGNNVTHSLMEAAALAGMDFVAATPAAYPPSPEVVARARSIAEATGARITITDDPREAAFGADALYTDVWLSMGDPEAERNARAAVLRPYQVNESLFARARPDAIFLHCLPAHRGEEVTAEVLDGPRSVVFDQAENRLHTAVAVLWALLERRLRGAPSSGPTPA